MSSTPAIPGLLNASTRLCAVLGRPVRHSASPAMHNAALHSLGLNWRYVACEVNPERLREAIDGARHLGFIGLNLTVPHKQLAVSIVDELDVSAQEWGAVNTVVFGFYNADGQWTPVGQGDPGAAPVLARGYNTDADAIIRALNEDLGIEPRSSRVLLLGAGGAGRAAALRLAAENVSVLYLVNRTQARAEELAREIEERYPAVEVHVGYPPGDVEFVLNATSLGLHEGDASPLDFDRFALGQTDGVYDMIYRPSATPLLEAARAAGCRAANGLGMLLYQGAAALELWTGQPAPVEIMRSALHREIYGGQW
jgi:shikimate dehydrogenase